MRRYPGAVLLVSLLAAAGCPAVAFATNGYFTHGVGIKGKGMGGATVAYPQDALAGGHNPAALAFVGPRLDVGIDWFRPDRGSRISGNLNPPANTTYDANDEQDFFIPELGLSKTLGGGFALGLTVYGQGVMNTSYTTPVGLLGTTQAGVDLSQMFIVPSVAVKIGRSHSLGLGVNLAWQRFKATGLQNFDNAMFTSHPGSVTDNGYATSTGLGFRVGWLSRVGPAVNFGAAYQSRTNMGEFDEYRGLFAENGDFDVPSMITAGVAVAAGERAVLVFDVSHIRYSKIRSVANPLLPNLGQARLGEDNGAGFGWEDVTVYKVGVVLEATRSILLRCGCNYGAQPISESETLFNILTPGIVEGHATCGATWQTPDGTEVSLAYMHAFEKTVEGSGSIVPHAPPAGMGGGEADLRMFEDSFAVAVGRSF